MTTNVFRLLDTGGVSHYPMSYIITLKSSIDAHLWAKCDHAYITETI